MKLITINQDVKFTVPTELNIDCVESITGPYPEERNNTNYYLITTISGGKIRTNDIGVHYIKATIAMEQREQREQKRY